MSAITKKIEGVECLDITAVQKGKAYTNTVEGSKNHGKLYNIYQWNGQAFSVNTEDDFVAKAEADEPLASVTFGVNDEGQFSLLSFVTMAKFNSYHALTTKAIERKIAIEAGNLEMLAALQD